MDRPTHVLPSPRHPRESGLHFLASGFHDLTESLLDWVRRSPEVTGTGVLRPALARQAYDELGLWAWDRRSLEFRNRGPLPPRLHDAVQHHSRDGWRSAADCLALDRLWTPARQLGHLRLRGRRAWPGGGLPEAAEEAGVHAMNHLLALCLWARDQGSLRPLPTVLLLLAGPTARPRTVDELGDAWHRAPENSHGYAPRWSQTSTNAELLRCLSVFGDTGLWIASDDDLFATELGFDFTRLLLDAIDHEFFAR